MVSDSSSNIRVFIRWDDQTVFAGEEIKCTITFKNVAADPSQHKQTQRQANVADRPRYATPLHRGKPITGSTPPTPSTAGPSRGHRSTLSLSAPAAFSRSRSGSIVWPQPPPHPPKSSDDQGNTHRRSISIVSIGSANTAPDDAQSNALFARAQRPGRGHARAHSLHIMPRAGLGISGPPSASPRQVSSPMFKSTHMSDRHTRSPGPSTLPNTPAIGGPFRQSRSPSSNMPEFKFPMAPSPLSESHNSPLNPTDDSFLSPKNESISAFRTKDSSHGAPDHAHMHATTPAMRILSSTSMGGTPRSSGEFYAASNHSSETLISEYPAHQQPLRGQHQPRPSYLRRSSNFSSQQQQQQQPKGPETIMMAYAQVQGSFTLDGSLINLAPFEQVKRKAVLGGQGGGVIGVETSSRRDSGLLRSFGWGSISSSLGDLLGTGELSSMKDMRGIASSKSVPLLSTPQSILFVDMQLAPGESKAFEYAFQLPRGLPPSHKGKAVKISYTLVIGTQRAGGTKEQQIRKVEVPFRVLGGVNSHGEILGYDLMNPYVILRDQAVITPLDKITPSNRNKAQSMRPESSLNDFITYVDDLLNRPRYGSHTGLLSPTAVPSSRRPSAYEDATTAKDAINLAILRSTHASEGGQSPNRFEIARNGQRVGVVTLTRAAYRIGEAVTMVVDFSNADVPCYALHCALESAERIADSQLALRSEASVHRVTRKVYASSSDTALYGRRLVFTPTIPINATPEFVTSGVALEWKIRVEFVVPSATTQQTKKTPVAEPEESEDASAPLVGNSAASGNTNPSRNHPLLEEISRDERGGLVLVAVENLACESFEVAVPLRVYGAFATGLEKLERDEASEEGLAV